MILEMTISSYTSVGSLINRLDLEKDRVAGPEEKLEE